MQNYTNNADRDAFNPLIHNIPKWSDTITILQQKIFNVCLTILGHYVLKG